MRGLTAGLDPGRDKCGLAVVDEITKALGGTADITSTLGQGTTVTITLPIYHAGQEHLHEPI